MANWSPVSLNTPISDASSLGGAVTIETFTPWTAGVKEGNGSNSWLAFPNAVTALVNSLSDQSVPALFVLAFTAGSYKDLAAQCKAMASVFPLKQIEQWQRHADKLAVLQQSKMQLVDAERVSSGIKLNAVPTVKARMQKALSQQAKASASSLISSDPLAALSAVESEKAAFDGAVDAALPALSGGAGWRFYADDDIATKLRSDHPGYEYAYTVLMAFIGEPSQLAYLREMMPEAI